MNEVKFKANIKDLASLQATVSEIPEIPTPETTDEGKVLTVSVDSSGDTPVAEYGLASPASGLPAIASGDAGKVLTVNDGETAAEWAAAASGGTVVKCFNISLTATISAGDTYVHINSNYNVDGSSTLKPTTARNHIFAGSGATADAYFVLNQLTVNSTGTVKVDGYAYRTDPSNTSASASVPANCALIEFNLAGQA